jgi:hypothetical protein
MRFDLIGMCGSLKQPPLARASGFLQRQYCDAAGAASAAW